MNDSVEEQLARTQQELDDLKAEYQEFAYVVSHDLGAPFRQIDGFAKIIAKNNSPQFDTKTMQHFNLITKGANRGMSIVEVLLDFSRLNTRTEPFSTVDCNEIVAEVLASFSKEIYMKNASIHYDELPNIQADAKQLKLLFHHLIDNALTFQPHNNEPRINMTTKKVDNGWKFTIQDNGIGVHPNAKDKIFNVLYRDITNYDQAGSGIGLALAKKIVKRHHGSIYIEPGEKEGSIFHFTIETA